MGALRSVLDRMHVSNHNPPDTAHQKAMRIALEKLHVANLQITEARALEELDLGRTFQQAALAEIQQIIRNAKRDRGIPLRPVDECEDLHRELLSRFRTPVAQSTAQTSRKATKQKSQAR